MWRQARFNMALKISPPKNQYECLKHQKLPQKSQNRSFSAISTWLNFCNHPKTDKNSSLNILLNLQKQWGSTGALEPRKMAPKRVKKHNNGGFCHSCDAKDFLDKPDTAKNVATSKTQQGSKYQLPKKSVWVSKRPKIPLKSQNCSFSAILTFLWLQILSNTD